MKMVTTIKRGATKKNIKGILDKFSENLKPKGIDAHQFCGRISLTRDALQLQRELRDEWE